MSQPYSDIKNFLVVAFLAGTPVLGSSPLDPYLLHTEEIPGICRAVKSELYPVHTKVALFYEYKAYRIILPPVLERQAQSFQCGGQNGTLYFFVYSQPLEAERAELFARPVLTRVEPAPILQSFPKGFVIVSFKDPPAALLEALNKKIQSHAVASSPAVQSSTETPTALPLKTAADASIPGTETPPLSPTSLVIANAAAKSIPADEKVSSVDVVAFSSPAVASPLQPSVILPGSGPDLPEDVLSTIRTELGCQQSDAPLETREVCQNIQAFQTGEPINPILSAQDLRLGVAYHINSFGQLDERYYDAVIGSGQPGEIALFPIHPSSGVEDIEAQSLIDSRRNGRPFPSTNELGKDIANHSRPRRQTLFRTDGRSHVMKLTGGKQIFIRQAGNQWILVSVTGESAIQQTRANVVVANLY